MQTMMLQIFTFLCESLHFSLAVVAAHESVCFVLHIVLWTSILLVWLYHHVLLWLDKLRLDKLRAHNLHVGRHLGHSLLLFAATRLEEAWWASSKSFSRCFKLVTKRRDLQILKHDCLVCLFQTRHQLLDLLLIHSSRPVVEKAALDKLASRLSSSELIGDFIIAILLSVVDR